MGWTSSNSWNSKKDVITELKGLLSAYNILADKSTTQAWYAVLENKETGERGIMVTLINKNGGLWGYKDMDENMGPNVCDCPLTFLTLAGEPRTEYARTWRKRVEAFHAQKLVRKNQTRYFILGLYVDGECVACKLAKPIGKSSRRFSIEEMQPFYSVPGTVKNLGEFYK